ncbi:MAG: hypothetical protein M1132_10970 [Chloroflexi bacterium]|nr:hypothetical protein [Chloroflexota bacterium]
MDRQEVSQRRVRPENGTLHDGHIECRLAKPKFNEHTVKSQLQAAEVRYLKENADARHVRLLDNDSVLRAEPEFNLVRNLFCRKEALKKEYWKCI